MVDRAAAAAASDLGVHRRLLASKSQQRSGSSSSNDSVHSKASTPTGKPALQSIVGNLAVPGEMRWPYSEDVFELGPGEQRSFATDVHLPVLKGRLYLASMRTCPVARPLEYYLTLNKKLRYIPFCADFGPFNLGTTHHVCTILKNLLKNPEFAQTKIIYYTSTEPIDITNAIYLLGAFLCIHLGATPEQAWKPFASLTKQLMLPYRDATWVKSSYDLHLKDCWAGVRRAMATNLYDPAQFDKNEYFYYDDPNNGDMHEVMLGKFIAFKGPRSKRVELVNGSFTMLPSDYVEVFKAKNVSAVVRLNNAEYDAADFTDSGFEHHDLFFTDCSTPSDDIVEKFLRISEGTDGLVAVHCLAGLGRTGTLIGLYMMKWRGFTARECMAWLRICRPGSIIGPQQAYLEDQEERMHMLGQQGIQGLGSTFRRSPGDDGRNSPKSLALARESAAALSSANKKSGVLADMVTDGMMNRDRARLRGHAMPSGAEEQSTRSTKNLSGRHLDGTGLRRTTSATELDDQASQQDSSNCRLPSVGKPRNGATASAIRKTKVPGLSVKIDQDERPGGSGHVPQPPATGPTKIVHPGKSGGFAARIKSLAGGVRESLSGPKKSAQQGEGGGLSNLQRTGTY